MNVFAIIAIGIIGAVLAVTVKSYRPEYGMAVSIACGILIMLFMAESVADVAGELRAVVEKTGIDTNYFKIILKVTGVSYITQFGAETAKDAGENAIATKIDAAGKVAVMLLTVPVISGFLTVITDMLSRL